MAWALTTFRPRSIGQTLVYWDNCLCSFQIFHQHAEPYIFLEPLSIYEARSWFCFCRNLTLFVCLQNFLIHTRHAAESAISPPLSSPVHLHSAVHSLMILSCDFLVRGRNNFITKQQSLHQQELKTLEENTTMEGNFTSLQEVKFQGVLPQQIEHLRWGPCKTVEVSGTRVLFHPLGYSISTIADFAEHRLPFKVPEFWHQLPAIRHAWVDMILWAERILKGKKYDILHRVQPVTQLTSIGKKNIIDLHMPKVKDICLQFHVANTVSLLVISSMS